MNVWRDYKAYNAALKELQNMMHTQSASDLMRDRIERAIAITTIATCSEVHEAYERLGSWDDVTIAAEKTCEGWQMSACVDEIITKRLACRLDSCGRNGAKAGILLREIAVACMKLGDEL